MCTSNVQLGNFGYTKEREERLKRREKESEKEVQLLHMYPDNGLLTTIQCGRLREKGFARILILIIGQLKLLRFTPPPDVQTSV